MSENMIQDILRADQALVQRGLAASRERAQGLIADGLVFANGKAVAKPAQKIVPQDNLEVRGESCPYVSRGGFKLEKALKAFRVDVQGKICVDIGASTGGFTDVLLQNGARHVYAVDVGTGQLDPKIDNDPRVTKIEQTNARTLTAEDFPLRPEIAVMDVSFISISKILPAVCACLKEGSYYMSLVKPQFEAGKELVGSHGVVRDPAVHTMVLQQAVRTFGENGLEVVNMDYSPIRGPEGNIEFLLLGRLHDAAFDNSSWLDTAKELVDRAHRELNS